MKKILGETAIKLKRRLRIIKKFSGGILAFPPGRIFESWQICFPDDGVAAKSYDRPKGFSIFAPLLFAHSLTNQLKCPTVHHTWVILKHYGALPCNLCCSSLPLILRFTHKH